MTKLSNATKRFRQGRISFQKLKEISRGELASLNAEIAKIKSSMESATAQLNDEVSVDAPHVHDDNCHHLIKHGDDDEGYEKGLSLEDLEKSLEEDHVHGENCTHH